MALYNERARKLARKRFLGALLVACGGLIALLCGACTLFVGVAGLISMGGGHGGGALLALALTIGGGPTGIGAFVCWLGIRMIREGHGDPAKTAKNLE